MEGDEVVDGVVLIKSKNAKTGSIQGRVPFWQRL